MAEFACMIVAGCAAGTTQLVFQRAKDNVPRYRTHMALVEQEVARVAQIVENDISEKEKKDAERAAKHFKRLTGTNLGRNNDHKMKIASISEDPASANGPYQHVDRHTSTAMSAQETYHMKRPEMGGPNTRDADAVNPYYGREQANRRAKENQALAELYNKSGDQSVTFEHYGDGVKSHYGSSGAVPRYATHSKSKMADGEECLDLYTQNDTGGLVRPVYEQQVNRERRQAGNHAASQQDISPTFVQAAKSRQTSGYRGANDIATSDTHTFQQAKHVDIFDQNFREESVATMRRTPQNHSEVSKYDFYEMIKSDEEAARLLNSSNAIPGVVAANKSMSMKAKNDTEFKMVCQDTNTGNVQAYNESKGAQENRQRITDHQLDNATQVAAGRSTYHQMLENPSREVPTLDLHTTQSHSTNVKPNLHIEYGGDTTVNDTVNTQVESSYDTKNVGGLELEQGQTHLGDDTTRSFINRPHQPTVAEQETSDRLVT